MKLIELIDYLIEPNRLRELYVEEQLNVASEALLIYMINRLDLDSEIIFFEIEETEDNLLFLKNGIQYVQLFPIEYAIELIESDLNLKDKGYSNSEIANRLLAYRLKDV
jgi:hypothetical protein